MLLHGTLQGLADPPGGVGREPEAALPVELVDGTHEAERALPGPGRPCPRPDPGNGAPSARPGAGWPRPSACEPLRRLPPLAWPALPAARGRASGTGRGRATSTPTCPTCSPRSSSSLQPFFARSQSYVPRASGDEPATYNQDQGRIIPSGCSPPGLRPAGRSVVVYGHGRPDGARAARRDRVVQLGSTHGPHRYSPARRGRGPGQGGRAPTSGLTAWRLRPGPHQPAAAGRRIPAGWPGSRARPSRTSWSGTTASTRGSPRVRSARSGPAGTSGSTACREGSGRRTSGAASIG